ncbi:Cysteine-rich TM module stress tolerance protein [Rhynchospora pubera]|uniref:Cysteine-rich TM module stress tolerance protein n=1 Tax=Rhynchospora pubera TaxID=906938 RepID=A0AAV8GP05_9POAL|nr:Cysteine-rich TM module stress tolerance protein [Rhynchospora pubera]
MIGTPTIHVGTISLFSYHTSFEHPHSEIFVTYNLQFSAVCLICSKMENPSANKNMPPPGYPTEQTMQPGAKPSRAQTKARGEKGFIEGCLAALCCCWICETCCI